LRDFFGLSLLGIPSIGSLIGAEAVLKLYKF
jgi:hypothetical protein